MSNEARMTRHAVAWAKDAGGAEFAVVELSADRMRARGVAIGSSGGPYRVDYELETTQAFVTSRVLVRAVGDGWSRRLELTHQPGNGWTADARHDAGLALPDAGIDVEQFAAARDVDLAASPLFNTMPVLRHRIHEGASAGDFLMVWVSLPDLTAHASPQRYTYVASRAGDERVVRFEAVGEGDDFEAEVIFDAYGLVVDYPDVARRMGVPPSVGRRTSGLVDGG
jgi:uncharacterized protein